MLLQQLVNGITIGSTYALVTIGFTMIFGVLELTNFAHSSFYMLGAYLALSAFTLLGVSLNAFILGIVLSLVICGLLAVLMDKIALRTMRDRKGAEISALLCTVGVQTTINNTILIVFGSETKSFQDVLQLGKFTVSNLVVPWIQVVIVVIAIILMLAYSLIVYKTKIGYAMRCISQDSETAKLMGIRVNKVISFAFFISAVGAAIAGILIGVNYQAVDITMASSVGLKSFAAAVLGGIGILPGAVLGGLVIGIVETLVAGYISSGLRDAIAFGILILVLILKPNGLLGKKALNKV